MASFLSFLPFYSTRPNQKTPYTFRLLNALFVAICHKWRIVFSRLFEKQRKVSHGMLSTHSKDVFPLQQPFYRIQHSWYALFVYRHFPPNFVVNDLLNSVLYIIITCYSNYSSSSGRRFWAKWFPAFCPFPSPVRLSPPWFCFPCWNLKSSNWIS